MARGLDEMFIVQCLILGAQGKNSAQVESWGFCKKVEAQEFFTEALMVNGDVEAELATELAREWGKDISEALEWSMQGPRGSTIVYRLECVEIE